MKYRHPCYQQQLHFVVKMGSIESLASATCHNQSGRGRAHISEVGPKNGWWEKGGERRHDNGAGDAASPLPTRALFCSAPASTILTPAHRDENNFYRVLSLVVVFLAVQPTAQ